MSERQVLDLLAQDAPGPSPDLADDVIDRAKRARRSRWTIVSACGAVVLIAAVPAVVALSRAPQGGRTVPPAAASTRPSGGTQTPAVRAPSDATQAYAAGIRYLAHQLVADKRWQVLFVLDHLCADAFTLTGCASLPIPSDVRHDLAGALQTYAPVRFVSDHAKIRDKDLTVIDNGVAVTLGRIQLAGNAGKVALAVQCGGLCGLGETLVVVKKNGIWTVTGATGPASMS